MSDPNADLSEAVQRGDVDAASSAVALGADINKGNNTGTTPLTIATIRSDVRMVRRLVKLGADVNAIDNTGSSALMDACSEKKRKTDAFEIAKILVDAGARIDIENQTTTPLKEAIISGNEKILDLLLDRGADPNYTTKNGANAFHMVMDPQKAPLFFRMAEKAGTLEVEHDAQKNTRSYPQSILGKALMNMNEEVVEYLLDPQRGLPKLDPATNPVFFTLAESAFNFNEKFVLPYIPRLIEAGFDPNVSCPGVLLADTMLTRVIASGLSPQKTAMLELLDHQGRVDWNKPDVTGNSPLQFAVQSKSLSVFQKALERGADPNSKRHDGLTVLAGIVKQKFRLSSNKKIFDQSSVGMAKLLVSSGARLDEVIQTTQSDKPRTVAEQILRMKVPPLMEQDLDELKALVSSIKAKEMLLSRIKRPAP